MVLCPIVQERNAFAQVFAQVFHLSLIRTGHTRIQVLYRVKYGPSYEVQPLAFVQFAGCGVDVCEKAFFCNVPVLSCCFPHNTQRVAEGFVREDTPKQRTGIACTASSQREVVSVVTVGIESAVVVESQVEVPYRLYPQFVCTAVFAQIATVESIGIACKFFHQPIALKALLVQYCPIAQFRIIETPAQNAHFHLVIEVLDIFMLFGGDAVFVG